VSQVIVALKDHVGYQVTQGLPDHLAEMDYLVLWEIEESKVNQGKDKPNLQLVGF
jgi:hypothetical protein